MVKVKTQEFRQGSASALGDPFIQDSLGRLSRRFDEARLAAIQEITPEVWEQLRESARAIKAHTLAHLDYYLELLDERVRQNGGVMHFARDSQEANSIIMELARSRGVKLVIKSKSMVSEEMGLNDAFAEESIQAVETDLGEYIIQLAEETPFHIIAPAMHKSKEQVSHLFAQKMGTPPHQDIPQLAQAAREALRETFLRADMGISGANFLVAETGTLVLVTNEGNGRMCTSLPRIHVALAGMEKLVPSLEDLGVFLRLLARSATGQRLTSYTTFVTGPRRDEEEDGPEEFYLIIVDNGRSRLLADPDLREALQCIRCGACLNICPVYRKVGGHAYGGVYSGPIGAVISPVLVGLDKAKDLPFASSLCGACREVCPVKINIPHMLLKLRSQSVEGGLGTHRKASWAERWLLRRWYNTVKSPSNFNRVSGLVRLLQVPLRRGGWLRRIPLPPFSKWTRKRDFPALASSSFRQRWQKHLSKDQAPE